MDFFVVFLIFAASLWFAWRGPVRPALSPLCGRHGAHRRIVPPPCDGDATFVILADVDRPMSPRFAIKLNAIALYGIGAVLAAAFYFQIALHELPCPLCLLQRVGFAALAIGPILTLRLGPRPSHYGLILIAALVGAAIAGRQILLHIAPGDPGYGSAILGYHFYTWAFVCFVAAIAAARRHPAVGCAVRSGSHRADARTIRKGGRLARHRGHAAQCGERVARMRVRLVPGGSGPLRADL